MRKFWEKVPQWVRIVLCGAALLLIVVVGAVLFGPNHWVEVSSDKPEYPREYKWGFCAAYIQEQTGDVLLQTWTERSLEQLPSADAETFSRVFIHSGVITAKESDRRAVEEDCVPHLKSFPAKARPAFYGAYGVGEVPPDYHF